MDPYDPATPQTGPPAESPKKKRHYVRWTLAGVGALIVAVVVVGVAGGSDGGRPVQPVTSTSAPVAPPQTATFTDPNGVTCAASTDGAYCPGDEPAPATTEPVMPVVYHQLTAHKWALITKDPDAHAGEGYVIYGEVTQFDANTGPSAFRADVGAVRQYPDEYGFVDYPTNTVLDGDADTLGPVVEKDLFTAKIMVTGSLDYDTQLGGTETVPELQIVSITVTGHASS